MRSVDLRVLTREKKLKWNGTERSGSGDPLPPETKLVTEARSSIHLPSRWSRYGSFFPGSELTPTAQWSRITLGHHTHTRTFKHDPDYFPNSMQSMQTHTVFRGGSNPGSTMGDFVWGWAVQRKFCVGAIRREDPDLRDGSPFTGSAASLPALPDFVRVRADAFPQSAGEATVVRIARKAPVHSSTKKIGSVNWNGTTGHVHVWKSTGLECQKAPTEGTYHDLWRRGCHIVSPGRALWRTVMGEFTYLKGCHQAFYVPLQSDWSYSPQWVFYSWSPLVELEGHVIAFKCCFSKFWHFRGHPRVQLIVFGSQEQAFKSIFTASLPQTHLKRGLLRPYLDLQY